MIEFAVETLKVEHIIVCGHYGCGGVRTALDDVSHGVISNWLRPIREIADLRADELAQTESRSEFEDKLCEFNVQRQVDNVSNSTVVTDAWRRGQEVTIHGWVYGLKDGLLRDLRVSRSG